MTAETTSSRVGQAAADVADTAGGEARDVLEQARDRARSTVETIEDEVRTRANDEAKRLAESLHDTSRRMQSMAGAAGDQSLAATLVREGASMTERLASTLERGGADAALANVRSWARRNPGSFLFGATVAGFVAGRVARNLAGARDNGHTTAGATFEQQQQLYTAMETGAVR